MNQVELYTRSKASSPRKYKAVMPCQHDPDSQYAIQMDRFASRLRPGGFTVRLCGEGGFVVFCGGFGFEGLELNVVLLILLWV